MGWGKVFGGGIDIAYVGMHITADAGTVCAFACYLLNSRAPICIGLAEVLQRWHHRRRHHLTGGRR